MATVNCNAADLVLGAVPHLEQRCLEAGLQLEVALDVVDGARVVADEEAVQRVLFNLVDNAAKYAAGAEDPRVHLEAGVEGSGRERQLAVRVRDHGPGIAPEARRGVFAPFERAGRDTNGAAGSPDSHGAPGAPGIGLGLSLARGIARQLGGELVLEEQTDPGTGPGAAFRLTLPLVPPAKRARV